jgi:hypothetical protein
MRLRLVVFALACLLPAGRALADLPPPDGTRFVDYGFRVDGLAKFPDRVLVAYPWSLSNGAPTRELAEVRDGEVVNVGRRSPTPALYALKKVAFEEFKKAHPEAFLPGGEPAALEELVRAAVRCDAAPSPQFSLSTSDTRSAIVDVFRAERLDDASCNLVAQKAAGAEPEVSPAGTDARAAGDGEGTVAPKGGGCAGCVVPAGRAGFLPGFASLLVGLGLLGRRRAQRAGAGPRPSRTT